MNNTDNPHTRPAPSRPLVCMRIEIANKLEELGYRPGEVTAFLAGATLFGHLRPGGSLWYVEHIIRTTLKAAHERDCLIERNGGIEFPAVKTENMKHI